MPGPYELYFVRHGLAEERGEAWPEDTKRPLTDEGISHFRKAVKGLSRVGVAVDVVLTSPLVRARQTAEILATGLDPRPSIVNIDLVKHGRKCRLAVVGHEPMLGELAARLIGSRHPLEFKKGGVCRIDLDDLPPAGPGDLRWMLTPKMLRALKK